VGLLNLPSDPHAPRPRVLQHGQRAAVDHLPGRRGHLGWKQPVRVLRRHLRMPKTSATWADAPTVRWRPGTVPGALLAGGGLPGRAMIFGLRA
jgi:hypothetical protein